MTDKAIITLGDTKLEAPVDRRAPKTNAPSTSAQLRAKTGYVTLDPAFMNTASTKSAITFIDGDKGILRYRGIPIEQLAEKSTFVETAYLLIYGNLPNEQQLKEWSEKLTRHSLLHEDMKHFFEGFPATAHPMAILERDGGGALELLPGRARRRQHRRSATSRSRGSSRRSGPSRPSRTRSRSASRSSIRRTRSRTARTSST